MSHGASHIIHRVLAAAGTEGRTCKRLLELPFNCQFNSQKMLRSALGPIQPHLKAIESILIAVEEAEHPKNMVQDKKGARVQPLDMLSRGYLGEATSNLISTLRIHKND